MTQEEIAAIYSAAQGVINKYADESRASYGGEQEAKENVASAPKREGPSKEERRLSRLIQREVKRALATGRTERLNEALKIQQDKRNDANTLPNSTIYQSPAQNEPVKISKSEPLQPVRFREPTSTKDELDFINSTICALGLYKYNNREVWISAGTIAGEVPSDLDSRYGKFIASSGYGFVWATIEVTQGKGEIDERKINSGTPAPENTDTEFHYLLGYYEFTEEGLSVTNYGCGNVEALICRNSFASQTPFFGATLTRCGFSST